MNLYSQVFNKLSGMEARPNRMNNASDPQKDVTQPPMGGAGPFVTRPPSPSHPDRIIWHGCVYCEFFEGCLSEEDGVALDLAYEIQECHSIKRMK